MNNYFFISKLKELDLEDSAIKWFEIQRDPQSAWNICHRGDWMIKMIDCGALETKKRKRLVLAICEIIRAVSENYEHQSQQTLEALDILEMWAKNLGTTLEDVKEATDNL